MASSRADRPRRADNTAPGPALSREERIGRVLADYTDRVNAGETVSIDAVLSAHPDLAAELEVALEGLRGLWPSGTDNDPLGVLGDYELLREIGRGGMGVVYEAWQGSMKRQEALKVLPAGIAADTRAVVRFVREAQLAGNLKHQNVVSVYGMGIEEKTPYYSMLTGQSPHYASFVRRLVHIRPVNKKLTGQ